MAGDNFNEHKNMDNNIDVIINHKAFHAMKHTACYMGGNNSEKKRRKWRLIIENNVIIV